MAIACVVPALVPTLKDLINDWHIAEFWLIPDKIITNIKFNVPNLREMGSDLVAGAIAAVDLLPNSNKLIVDCGTATTILAVNSYNQYQGVAILPGIGTQLNALTSNAANLKGFTITPATKLLATETQGAISSGIIYSHVATIEYFVNKLIPQEPHLNTILTGGWANLLIDYVPYPHYPNLIFQGLVKALELNGIAYD